MSFQHSITTKLLAAALLESETLRQEVFEKSRDSETEFLGVRLGSDHKIIVERLPADEKLVFHYRGLNLGQSCLKEKGLKIKLQNLIRG